MCVFGQASATLNEEIQFYWASIGLRLRRALRWFRVALRCRRASWDPGCGDISVML